MGACFILTSKAIECCRDPQKPDPGYNGSIELIDAGALLLTFNLLGSQFYLRAIIEKLAKLLFDS